MEWSLIKWWGVKLVILFFSFVELKSISVFWKIMEGARQVHKNLFRKFKWSLRHQSSIYVLELLLNLIFLSFCIFLGFITFASSTVSFDPSIEGEFFLVTLFPVDSVVDITDNRFPSFPVDSVVAVTGNRLSLTVVPNVVYDM